MIKNLILLKKQEKIILMFQVIKKNIIFSGPGSYRLPSEFGNYDMYKTGGSIKT